MRYIYFIGCLLVGYSSFSQESVRLVSETFKMEKVKDITEFLASDDLAGRDTPSEGLDEAAEYIEAYFKNNGIGTAPGMDGYFQQVNMIHKTQPDRINILHQNQEVISTGSALQLSGGSGSFRENWVIIDPQRDSIDELGLKNKLLIIYIDNYVGLSPMQILEQSRNIRRKALEKDASGMIVVFGPENAYWERFYGYYTRPSVNLDLSEEAEGKFQHLLVQDLEHTFRKSLEESPSGKIHLDIQGSKDKSFATKNIIGFVEGTDPELKKEYIVCTAHYDHVGIGRPDATGDSIYNGARDNAIGVMSVMLAAENMARYPAERSVLFVLLTGEEKGLLGSRWFIQQSPVDLKDIIFCLNSDGGGYNDTTMVTVMGKRRLQSGNLFEKACQPYGLSAFDGTDETQFLFNSSDNIIFSRKGIPSVTFSTGFREMDAEIMKYYHQPSDETGTLDYDYVLKFSRAYGTTLRILAGAENQLFWKEDDEFHAVGVELYHQP